MQVEKVLVIAGAVIAFCIINPLGLKKPTVKQTIYNHVDCDIDDDNDDCKALDDFYSE